MEERVNGKPRDGKVHHPAWKKRKVDLVLFTSTTIWFYETHAGEREFPHRLYGNEIRFGCSTVECSVDENPFVFLGKIYRTGMKTLLAFQD